MIRRLITVAPVALLALGLAITAAQTPAKLAHTVNTHTPGVTRW
jgi:hypothetical protein